MPCAQAQPLLLCLTICDPVGCTRQALSVRLSRARKLERVTMASSRGSAWPRVDHWPLCLLHCRQVLYGWATWESHFIPAAAAASLQSCPTASGPMDCSLPGSSVPGIFQARVLEWVADFIPNPYEILDCKKLLPNTSGNVVYNISLTYSRTHTASFLLSLPPQV